MAARGIGMKSWLEPKAFWIAFLVMAVLQVSANLEGEASFERILLALTTSVIGGVFWGAIGTYIYRRIRRRDEGRV